MDVRKKLLNLAHPILYRLSNWYLSKTRTYTYHTIRIRVHPGVFHPGLFFSTKALLQYIEKNVDLKGRRVLELGAGTGLLSFYCASKGAMVTASDISTLALENLSENNNQSPWKINIQRSDLFTDIHPDDFEYIVINPPYYPKEVRNEKEMAWYCGSDFGYFRSLFQQIQSKRSRQNCILIILSEDCNIETIAAIAHQHGQQLLRVSSTTHWGEVNFIFTIEKK